MTKNVWRPVAVFALISGAFLWPALQLRFNNDQWLDPDHPQERALDYLAEEFAPGEQAIVALVEEVSFFTPARMTHMERLEAALEQALGEDLVKSRSALSALTIVDTQDTLETESFQDLKQRGLFRDTAALQEAFARSPYAGLLLSQDEQVAALELQLDTRGDAPRRSAVMHTIRHTIQNTLRGTDMGIHLLGGAVLKEALNRKAQEELPRLLAAGGILLGILAFAVLRAGASLVLGGALMSLVLSLAVVVLLGHDMTVVALCLPVLVTVIAVADGLHILMRRDYLKGASPGAVMAQMWRPCLMTTLTSAIGFGSFFVSDLLPLKHFGVDALVGISLVYPLILGFFWLSFSSCPPTVGLYRERLAGGVTGFLRGVHTLAMGHTRGVLLVSAVSVSAAAAGLMHMTTESSFLSVFFKKDSQIVTAFHLADQKLGGSGEIDVVLKGEPYQFNTAAALFEVLALEETFEAHLLINHARSYEAPLSQVHRALSEGSERLPDTDEEVAQELLFLELSRDDQQKDVLSGSLNFDQSAARLHLRTPDLPSAQLAPVVDTVRHTLQDFPGETLLTGFGIYLHTLSAEVLRTQAASLGLALALISILFVFQFGIRQGACAVLVTLLPLLVSAGLMSWMGIPFDFATVLVASVTLGLCVDDTIHFLHAYRLASRETDVRGALLRALQMTGWPIILTTVLFCAALSTLLLSDLVMLVRFCVFTNIGLICAVLSTLVVLPALLSATEPRR